MSTLKLVPSSDVTVCSIWSMFLIVTVDPAFTGVEANDSFEIVMPAALELAGLALADVPPLLVLPDDLLLLPHAASATAISAAKRMERSARRFIPGDTDERARGSTFEGDQRGSRGSP